MKPAAIRTMFVAFMILRVGAVAAAAQGELKCDDEKTLEACYRVGFEEQAKGMTTAEAAKKVEDKAAISDTQAAKPSLADFLPAFLGNLGIDGLSDTNGNITFDRVIAVGDYWRVGLGFTAFASPEVFEPLKKALPEAIRDERVKTLSEGIGDFDKVDYRLSVSREDDQGERRFGRDAKDYKDLFEIWHEQIVETLTEEGTPFGQWALSDDVKQSMDDYEDAGGVGFFDAKLADLVDKLGEERVEKLKQGIVATTQADRALKAKIDKATGQIDDMIANQPQIYLKVDFRQRDEITGPEEIAGKLVYEMGMSGNINDFISWSKDHQNQCTGTESSYPDYACMQKYLKQKPKAADNGNRLAISVEYASADGLDFQLPGDNFTFKLDKTEKWIGSLSYGRYFPKFSFLSLAGQDGSGVEDGTRFELEASYEDVSGDPMRQARFVAIATFSQKMSKQTLFSVSAVYANKPEYLGEVDEQVSARFGFRWQYNPKGET